MSNLQVSVEKEQILNDGWHVLGLFDGQTEECIHLEIHSSRDKEGETEAGNFYENLTGKSIANFLASRTRGLLQDGEKTIVLEFDTKGSFIKAF